MESAVGVQLAFCGDSSFPGTDRPFHAPLLPSRTRIAISSTSYISANSALASIPSTTRMQTLTLTNPHSPSPSGSSQMNSAALSRKETKLPALKLYEVPSGAAAASRSPFTRRSVAVSSLHQRAFHHEPYPESPVSPIVRGDSQFDLLPPFPSPTSPKYRRSAPLGRPPRIHESQSFWLILYFFFNLGLTLYNKLILVRFPFPYTLSAIHALFGTIGGHLLVRAGVFVPTRLNAGETVVLLGFSVLYTINIVISNVSLQLVTVPFHQVVRASTPLFTIIFGAILLGVTSSRARIISLIPVVAGVGFATFGEYYFTPSGFLLTLLGTMLAALKTIYTNVLQSPPPAFTPTSSKPDPGSLSTFRLSKILQRPYFKNPLDLLLLLSPLAFIQCVLLAHFSGELNRVHQYSVHDMTLFKANALLVNGCIAFGLNVVSFSANRWVGALGMTVAANVKQVLTIVCAVLMFNLTITPTNALGIVLTLVGGAWYAWVEFMEKQAKTRGSMVL